MAMWDRMTESGVDWLIFLLNFVYRCHENDMFTLRL